MTHKLLEIQLFGGVALLGGNDDSIPVTGVHPACLLAILALHTNRPYTRDELIDLLWPEEDQDTGRQRLRQALYALRQQIAQVCGSDSGILHATRTTVGITADRIATDVAAFESDFAAAVRASESEERLPLLAHAVSLYRGKLAPGVQIEPILAERNRLSAVHLKALHLLAQAYERTGQFEKAIETAHRAVAANPLLEEAHCDLMRLYSASGQSSAVVRQYQELERILEAELGEQPSDATRELMEALRRSGMDRIAARPRNGAQEPAVSHGASGLRNGVLAASASLPVDSGPTRTVFVSPLSAPVRRRWPLALVIATILVVFVWFTIILFSARRHRQIDVPAPQTLWERRIPLGPGDGDSEPAAISVDQIGSGVYIVGFVQTAKRDTDFVTLHYDAEGKLLWQRRYNGPGNDVDRARSVAVSEPGNVFVTGESDNGRGNGTTRLSGLDIATIKYDFSGKQLWVARYNGPEDGEDRPCRIVADGQGGCVVAGYSRDGQNADKSSRWAGILVAYDARGHQRWALRARNPEDLDCRFTDLGRPSGGVVALGHAYRGTPGDFETETFLIRYDMNGKLRWRRQVSVCPGKDDYLCKLCLDDVGNSYVAARAYNFPQSDHGIGTDCLVAKYDPDGNTKWVRTYDGPSHLDDSLRGVCVDTTTRVTVTGESLSAPNDLDIATVQYDADGAERWARRFAGAGGSVDAPNDIVAWHDCVFVTGFTSSRHPSGSDLGGRDYVTLKYDANGALVWRAIYDGPLHNLDFGVCLTVDYQGNAIITGQSSGLLNRNILTLKYAP